MVIDFRADGAVEAMHRDQFDLSFLGKQDISRASDIKFDSDTQLWDIHVAEGEAFIMVAEAKGFPTYDEARRMEVRWFEACRLHSIPALGQEGINLLKVLRKRFD